MIDFPVSFIEFIARSHTEWNSLDMSMEYIMSHFMMVIILYYRLEYVSISAYNAKNGCKSDFHSLFFAFDIRLR